MTYEDIPGWFDYQALYDAAVAGAEDGATFVEIGCWLGKSTAYLAQKIKESGKKIKFYAVDHGFGSPGGDDYVLHDPVLKAFGGNVIGKMLSNLRDCDVLDYVTVIAGSSLYASRLFSTGELDFVFIDAAHDPASVKQDLEVWWPKIKVGGGVMSGHDYDGCWLGVVDTVDTFFGGGYRNFELKDANCEGCWSIRQV